MSDVLELGRKRCEELGLKFFIYATDWNKAVYLANNIHKVLGEGVETRCNKYGGDVHIETAHPTHQALLIGIKPIVRDTAIGLVREMVESGDERSWSHDWFKRARALLGEKP